MSNNQNDTSPDARRAPTDWPVIVEQLVEAIDSLTDTVQEQQRQIAALTIRVDQTSPAGE